MLVQHGSVYMLATLETADPARQFSAYGSHPMMRAAYLVDGLRSPFGRYGGGLAGVRADDLAAAVIAALVAKTKIPVDRIDDVILGCANQAGEDNRNVARMSALLAGLPVAVPGVTVNRLCGSGMQAVADAARLVMTGEADLVIAGGVEQMTRAPLVMAKPSDALAARQPDHLRHDARAGGSSTRRWSERTARSRWARPPRRSPSSAASRARRRIGSR